MSEKPSSQVQAVVAAEAPLRKVAKILEARLQVARRRAELLDQVRELSAQAEALEEEIAKVDAILEGPAIEVADAVAGRRTP